MLSSFSGLRVLRTVSLGDFFAHKKGLGKFYIGSLTMGLGRLLLALAVVTSSCGSYMRSKFW